MTKLKLFSYSMGMQVRGYSHELRALTNFRSL